MLKELEPQVARFLTALVELGQRAEYMDPNNCCAVSYMAERMTRGGVERQAQHLLQHAAGGCGYNFPLNGCTCHLSGHIYFGRRLELYVYDEYPHSNFRAFVPAAQRLIEQFGFERQP
jgi:hypothetical protein